MKYGHKNTKSSFDVFVIKIDVSSVLVANQNLQYLYCSITNFLFRAKTAAPASNKY
jgi:hypothetical protein